MKETIRYLTSRRRRNGATQYYWQPSPELRAAGWKVEPLGADLEPAKAKARVHNQSLDDWRAGLKEQPVTAQHGSVQALIADYKNNWRFEKLAKKTKDHYEYSFRILRRLIGDFPVLTITPLQVQKIYTDMRGQTPAKAAAVIRVLRLLLEHGRRAGFVHFNAAEKPGLETGTKKGLPWSPAAVEAFVATADAMDHFTIGTMVFLNEWFGQRKGDVLEMGRADYRDGRLHNKQNKTDAEVALPLDLVPRLKNRLELQLQRNDAMRIKSVYLFPTEYGQPYSDSWSGYLFRCIRDKAVELHGKRIPELKHLIFKDLRHTAVTRLAEAGCTIPQIASITGHTFRSCQDIVDRYNIRTSKMAEEAFKLRLAAETNGPGLSLPATSTKEY